MKTIELGFDVLQVQDTITKMENELVYMLEIDVSNGIFVDNGQPIIIANKTVNYPKDVKFANDKYSINYEPFENIKIAHWMFTKYAILRQMEDPNLSVSSFFTSKYLTCPNYLFATCRTNRGDFNGLAFVNESVSWINLIYTMEYGSTDYMTFKYIDDYITIKSKEKELAEGVANAKHSYRRF